MAKDLTGTNVAAQKEATYYSPAWTVDLVRDHPETGESIFRVSSWSGPFVLGANTYRDLVMRLGEVRIFINPGGGLAYVGDWSLTLLNPIDAPAGGRLSDMLDDYFLENDEVRFGLVFRTGSEGSADQLRMFTGLIQSARINTMGFTLNAKDATRVSLRDVPQEFLDRIRFPDAPLNVQDLPYPVPFGNMNVEPFNTSGSPAVLAACIATNIFDGEYTPGLYCKSYGQPYVYYRSARIYGRIESYTQTNQFFTIDSASRFASILPMRPDAGNDVSTWRYVSDRNSATSVSLVNGDNLDLRMRGAPKLGTVTAIEIKIQGSGQNVGYTISKTGETDITGTTSAYPAAIDISSWDFSSDWDFENIVAKIDGPASSTTTIWSLTLDVTFDEQETGDKLAFPVFQSVTGYQDVSTQYQDGAAIVSANQLLSNPIYQAVALMRDKRMGMRIASADIETSNLSAEVAKISDWKFDYSLTQSMTVDQFSEMLRQGKIRLFRTFDNKWKFSVFDETDDPIAVFDRTNITVANPDAEPEDRGSSFEAYQSPLSEVYNEIVIDYGWNPALGVFTSQEVATHHYTLTGTAVLNSTAGTLTDSSATFQTDGVQVGYKVFVIRDKLYTVDAVNSETELEISPSVLGAGISNRSDTYYLGPNYDFNCHRSLLKYKQPNRLHVQSQHIHDETTAQNLLQYLIDYFSQRRYMAKFKTWLNAVDVEIGDLVIIDDEDLPPRKRPQTIATVGTGGTTKAATTGIPVANPGAYILRPEDRLIVRPAGARLVREGWKVTSSDGAAGTVAVSRGYSGTVARSWVAGDLIQRAITKWEVVEQRIMQSSNEIEITVRETPRHYTPVGYAAPSGTPDYTSADAVQIAASGFACFPNGEASWLDEDSSISFARTV